MATKENRLLKNTNIKIKEGKEKYSMFPYQEKAIKNLEKLDKVYDTYRTLVVVPTGGGKTRIAVEYLNRNVLNRQGTKVLWICERLSLLTQAHHSFVDHTYRDSLEHGGKPFKASEITAHVFSSQDTSFREEYKSEDVQMVFVTKQTLCKMFGFADNSGKQKEIDESFKDWLENTDELTVIIDEAHHAVGDDYRSIIHALLYMAQAKIHIIGLTATPKNTNGSRIEEIFLHGIDPKSKQPTDKTCYASRVSINQLIAEGYLAKPFLAKKKDSSPEKLSDEELCNRIIDTYEKGVCALALETPSSQDEDTKAPKELNPNNSFGQTVIFVKSREVARLLWSKFLARDIDCGISISTDGNNDLTQYKNLQDYIERIKENMKNRKDKALSSDQIVKIYEERYAKNILPVIVSVDKFKEGVDVPKTQTVFIARDSSTEISVTQEIVPETSDNESNNKVYYLDPPYFLTNQYACEFSDENHLEMLKRLREAEYNWIFSCKSKETNESLSKRSKKAKERYIHTEKGKLFEEYFKLFLYDKKVDTNSKEVCADTEKGIIQKKDLYVYYAEPLEDNYYEIMISNIPPNKDDAQVLKSYNFRCEEFRTFFNHHDYDYDI